MSILVIGGNGFIGSHIIDKLVERGIPTRVLDRRVESFREKVRGVDYVIDDFSKTDVLTEALVNIDCVIYLASGSVPYTSNIDPVSDINNNLVSLVTLLSLMRTVGVKNIIYFSSGGAVYGQPQRMMMAEDHPINPISSYGITKFAAESYIRMESVLHGLDYCILRPSNPYGPRQGHTGVQGIIGTFLWKIAANEPVEIWGTGETVRDFLYIEDLADLCMIVLDKNLHGTYNVGSGEGMAMKQIVEVTARVTGREVRVEHKPGRAFDPPSIVLDIHKIQNICHWTPKTSLDLGVARTFDWVLSQAKPCNK